MTLSKIFSLSLFLLAILIAWNAAKPKSDQALRPANVVPGMPSNSSSGNAIDNMLLTPRPVKVAPPSEPIKISGLLRT